MLKALIFDFDGLILDTETPEFLAWQSVFRAHDASLTLEEWAICIGTNDALDPYALLETRTGRTHDAEIVRTLKKSHFTPLIDAETLRPGVRFTMETALALGLKIGVASSSTHDWVESWLRKFELIGHLSSIQCSEDVEKVKPHPALYLHSLDALGVCANEALALEDSLNGLRAAKAAGIHTIAIPNPMTRHLPLHEADQVLDSLENFDLAAVARRFP